MLDTRAGWKQVLQTAISMDGLILQTGQGRGERIDNADTERAGPARISPAL